MLRYNPTAYTFGLRGVCALPLGVAAEQSVHYFWDYFSFLSFFSATYFSPKRGWPRVMKFCTEFYVTKNKIQHYKKKLGPP